MQQAAEEEHEAKKVKTNDKEGKEAKSEKDSGKERAEGEGGRSQPGKDRKDRREAARDKTHDDKYKAKPYNRGVMQIMLKAILNLFQRVRDVEAVVITVVLLPAAFDLCEKMRAETVKYERMVKEAGKGHSYGPPDLHRYAVLVETLMADTKVNEHDRELLKEENERLAQLTGQTFVTVLGQQVHLVRLVKTFKSETKRLLLSISTTVAPTIVQALVDIGGDLKTGRAPPGAMEDELERWLVRTFMKEE